MINGLEGIPGSGKSYEAVAMHVLPALAKGRLVITNLPLLVTVIEAVNPDYVGLIELRMKSQPVLGLWDAEAVDDKGNGNAFNIADVSLFEPVQNVPVFGSVWDYYSTWKHPDTGQGPLFIIDEAHLALPTSGTNQQVIEWYKLHRHFNADVLLATQSFRDINQPIARLIAILIKCRKADILGKKDCYIRKVHSGYRGAVISTEERKYKPEYFKFYRSHTQGNGVTESSASDVAPFLVKFNRFRNVFLVLTGLYTIYAVWGIYHKPPVQTSPKPFPVRQVPPAATLPQPSASAPQPSLPALPAPGMQPMQPMPHDEVPEPYATKGIHLTGRITLGKRTVYTFAISNGTVRISQATSDDLRLVGYVWEPLTDCAGTLRWKGGAKSVTCDAPLVPEASSSDPVVLVLPAGTAGSASPARSDGKQVAFK